MSGYHYKYQWGEFISFTEPSCENLQCGPDTHLDEATCQCLPCPPLHNCNKTCRHGYKLARNGCPRCKCQKCPPFSCPKDCPHGYVTNSKHCRLCKCQRKLFLCVIILAYQSHTTSPLSSYYDHYFINPSPFVK